MRNVRFATQTAGKRTGTAAPGARRITYIVNLGDVISPALAYPKWP
jgi:hypothetical protein